MRTLIQLVRYSDLFQSQTLKTLELQHNKIDAEGAQYLSDGIKLNKVRSNRTYLCESYYTKL